MAWKQLEICTSSTVFDPMGRPLGSIRMIRAQQRDGAAVIVEYVVEPQPMWAWLSTFRLGRRLLTFLDRRPPSRFPADQLDFTDAGGPYVLIPFLRDGSHSGERDVTARD